MLWTLPCVQKSGLLLRRRQADQQNRGRALHLCWISTLSSALLLSPASHHPQTSRFSLTKFLSKVPILSSLDSSQWPPSSPLSPASWSPLPSDQTGLLRTKVSWLSFASLVLLQSSSLACGSTRPC